MHSITYKTEIIRKMGSIIDENCFYVDLEYCIFPLQFIHNFVCLNFPVYQYLLGSATQSMNMNNLIIRRDQHLKVVIRLVNFYEDSKHKLNKKILNIIKTRLKCVAFQQYLIYLNMNPKEVLPEIICFDKWLKNDHQIYIRGQKESSSWCCSGSNRKCSC